MSRARHRRTASIGLLTVWALVLSSCGDVIRQGRSPAYLVIETIEAASGAEPELFGNTLASDVVTRVTQTIGGVDVQVPTIFADPGRVALRLALKDVGTTFGTNAPTSNNDITVTRYRVVFKRSDGRNTPGADVPYPFDGAFTGTVTLEGATFDFVLVRVQAKAEPPLSALAGGGGAIVISTIAEVTFFGRDQVGNDVSVTGAISVNFADFGDPEGS